jgi:hypothetical protein
MHLQMPSRLEGSRRACASSDVSFQEPCRSVPFASSEIGDVGVEPHPSDHPVNVSHTSTSRVSRFPSVSQDCQLNRIDNETSTIRSSGATITFALSDTELKARVLQLEIEFAVLKTKNDEQEAHTRQLQSEKDCLKVQLGMHYLRLHILKVE